MFNLTLFADAFKIFTCFLKTELPVVKVALFATSRKKGGLFEHIYR